MDYKKIILYGALFVTGLSLWTSWQQDYPANKAANTKVVAAKPTTAVPQPASSTTDAPAPAAQQKTTTSQYQAPPAERLIKVYTNEFVITIDTLGGKLVKTALLNYQKELNAKNNPFILLNDAHEDLYFAQSGLTNIKGNNVSQGQLLYQSAQRVYRLAEGQKQLQVILTWRNKAGLEVNKTLTFKRGSFLIDVKQQIKNRGKQTWRGAVYNQITKKKPEDSGFSFMQLSAYQGASISDPENKRFEKISFKDMGSKNLDREIKGGWIAMQQHYFLSAWIPPENQTSRFYSRDAGNGLYTIGFIGPELKVTSGETVAVGSKLYVGPEIMEDLKQIAPNLDLTVDYGWLWFISIGLFWLLKNIFDLVGNWGWAIIIVTLLIKLAFYHLSASSYRSMAGMRKLQPRIQALKERFGDDRQKMSQAMMELYKTEKLNPLGGCLPILVQIPVFIALYWVLLESVELRHAPFMLWLRDLSAADPYFILPILMGATMVIQQRLNPTPPDPVQAKVMMFLPVLFTGLFLFFPAGLVLYWLVNNALSILQQWYITRQVEAGGKNGNTKKLAKAKK